MIRPISLWIAGLSVLVLSACSDDSDSTATPNTQTPPAVTTASSSLCVSSDCGEAVPLVTIPDAENILFTPQGRLFVSGGLNVYEISKMPDASFIATPIADAECNFTGLVLREGYLYAVCGDSRFFAGELTATPVLTQIYTFAENMCIPNGATLGADGKIYVVDEPLDPTCLPPDPRIVRLTVDPADPMQITAQETWVQGSPLGLQFVGLDQSLRFPNGLDHIGNTFYSTDGGVVFSVELLPDGSAGPPTALFFEPTAHDDLSVSNDQSSLLVTDFFTGKILQLSLDGELLQQTNPLTFSFPSAVQQARPPMFESSDILVTEKGILTDTVTPVGNQLTLFRRSSE
ncbi:MAG: hypothetical protein ACPHER_05275 [Nevskiales bacterium]